jgi:hypothetical protein
VGVVGAALTRCVKCEVEKPVGEFYRSTSARSGRRSACKDCTKAGARKRYHANRDGERDRRYRARYEVTADQVDQMRAEQGYRCRMCRRHEDELPLGLMLDHCHITGIARGMLCDDCNKGFGFLRESPEIIEAALHYATRAAELISIYQTERD